tara:strand:+ start:165 stop:773 length:609 start_codon:yes stop_codon:yes gene_type:complete
MRIFINFFVFSVFTVFFSSELLAEDLFLKCKINEKREQLTKTFDDVYKDLELKKFQFLVNLFSKNKKEFLITIEPEVDFDYLDLEFKKFIGMEHTQGYTLSDNKDLMYMGFASQHFVIEVASNGQTIENARLVNSGDENYSNIKKSKKTYIENIKINRETGEIQINKTYVYLNDNLLPTDEIIYPHVRYVGTCKINEQKTLF